MKHLFSLIVVVLFLTSCSSTKEIASTGQDISSNEASEISESNENRLTFDNIAKDDSLFASISKGYCYGTCPVYKMKIYNNGLVELEGIRNIDLIGAFTTKLSKEQMIAFIEKAKAINYMELDDVYDNKNVTDLPAATTSIVIDGKRKQVKRRHGYPRSILAFEKLFEDLLTTQKWVTVNIEKEK